MSREPGGSEKPSFDLEERTACFGERIIGFARGVPRNEVTLPLISQLVRSGTSIGANYVEARALWQEAQELNLIFSAIRKNTRGK